MRRPPPSSGIARCGAGRLSLIIRTVARTCNFHARQSERTGPANKLVAPLHHRIKTTLAPSALQSRPTTTATPLQLPSSAAHAGKRTRRWRSPPGRTARPRTSGRPHPCLQKKRPHARAASRQWWQACEWWLRVEQLANQESASWQKEVVNKHVILYSSTLVQQQPHQTHRPTYLSHCHEMTVCPKRVM